MRLAMIVEYDGTDFCGFQSQSNVPTIQQEIEKAISRFTGEDLRIKGAGRTDSGVHAQGQVIAFDTEATYRLKVFKKALNHYLSNQIAVKEVHQVEDNFDPRRMALSRHYRYTMFCGDQRSPLLSRTSHHIQTILDLNRMVVGTKIILGRHDFARFAGPTHKTGISTVREIYRIEIQKNNYSIELDVEGNSFLPQQVRRIAGALVDIGNGKLDQIELKKMVEGEASSAIARTLPPNGLCLISVKYENFPP